VGTHPQWGAQSSCGLVRKVNEDSFLAEPPIFIVADGMGGHAAGDVASDLAVHAFTNLIGRVGIEVSEVIDVLHDINTAILHTVDSDTTKDGMGTTLTGMVLVQISGVDHWMIFNIGDSRVYQLVNHDLHQITIDHSEVQELVAAGKLSKEEAKVYPQRNVITRALGSLPAPQVDTWIIPSNASDRFIICSDGLTNEVSDEQIQLLSDQTTEPQLAASLLVDAANAAGGRDNITVIVVDSIVDPVEGLRGNTVPRRGN
jgi:serine/threonine protein phosphatase PrpC